MFLYTQIMPISDIAKSLIEYILLSRILTTVNETLQHYKIPQLQTPRTPPVIRRCNLRP